MLQGEKLVELNARDLISAFKLSGKSKLWQFLAQYPAKRLAHEMLEFDKTVEQRGIVEAGRFLLNRFSGSVTVSGAEKIPKLGPLIVASNHPGMMDAMALWTAISREDLKIVAAKRDLLDLLPNMQKYLIQINPNSCGAFREAASHLKSGGALLTFPAGRIEPDVGVREGAIQSLENWSPSVIALKRRVEEATVLPAFVYGVISKSAMKNPLLNSFKDQKEHDWAAATLQILAPSYRRVGIHAAFGRPACTFEDLIAQMKCMIQNSEGELRSQS